MTSSDSFGASNDFLKKGIAYEKMYPYADDLALVVDESGYYEYIDLDGNVAF